MKLPDALHQHHLPNRMLGIQWLIAILKALKLSALNEPAAMVRVLWTHHQAQETIGEHLGNLPFWPSSPSCQTSRLRLWYLSVVQD